MFKTYFSILNLFCLFYIQSYAQVGGKNSFEFMRIPDHARLVGVGGINISAGKEDINMFSQNPALLNEQVGYKSSLNYSKWQADIHNIALRYVHPLKRTRMLGFEARMLNYGKMNMTDESGAIVGKFQANDFALGTSFSLRQDYFRFGASLKFLGSQIGTYNAYALVADLGATFEHPKKDFTVGMVIKNLGFLINKYTPEQQTDLPFDVQLGTSFKPEYMPFRFSVTLHHLYQFDIVYFDPLFQPQLDASGNPIIQEKKFLDKLARHFVLGGELLLTENFNIRLGYNHLINKEMKVQELGGLRGFSFGAMLRVKAFEFGFSHGTYHIGTGRSYFTLIGDMSQMRKRKKTVKEGRL